MALDDVAAEPVGRPQRQLEVDLRCRAPDPPARCARASRSSRRRRTSRRRSSTRGEADAVDRDRVARRSARHERRRDRDARTPSPERSTPATAPTPCTSPVNTATTHHSLIRAETSRSSPTRSQSRRERSHRVGDHVDALALERVARGPPAEHHRGEEQPDLVDLAGVEERAREMWARPRAGSSRRRRRRADRAPSGRGPARSRRSRRSPPRRGSRARRSTSGGAARETTTVSGIVRASRTSLEVSGRRASESKTTRRGWRDHAVDPRGQQRIVGERGADPDRDRVALGPPVVGEPSALLPEIHFESPLRVATLPSSVIADLNSTHGRPVRDVLAERLVEQPGADREFSVGDHDLDALVAQDPEAAAGRVLARVVGGDDDARDPGLPDRVGARRRAALVAAGLERHVQGRAAQIATLGGADRLDFGVRRAEFLWKPSPSTSCWRPITAPTSGFGLTRPRPPSASSIARARWRRSVSVVADMAAPWRIGPQPKPEATFAGSRAAPVVRPLARYRVVRCPGVYRAPSAGILV